MPDQLLEQSPDWGWFTHGETGDALLKQNALNERDRLAGDDAICFDLLNTRTGNGQGTTSPELRDMRETATGGRGSWSIAKINRLLRKLERKGLAFIDGSKPRPGDLGGTPSKIWWSFEREQTPQFANEAARFAELRDSPETGSAYEFRRRGRCLARAGTTPADQKMDDTRWRRTIIPCHPVDSQVSTRARSGRSARSIWPPVNTSSPDRRA